jgi:excisionase family DNA binding protein
MGSQKQPIFRTDEWITQAQAARLRRVSRQAIAKLIRKGTFSILEIGGRIFLRRRDVEEYRPAQGGRPRLR